jgi:hypothetical protein
MPHHWSILTFDVRTIQEFYMKEISSIDFPQHGEVFYFYGQALPLTNNNKLVYILTLLHIFIYVSCEWCPGQNKRIAPLPFFH